MVNRVIIFLSILIFSCSTDPAIDDVSSNQLFNEYDWVIPKGKITGHFNLFPLVTNHEYLKAKEIDYFDDEAYVVMVNFHNEIRIYPYEQIAIFESINETLADTDFSITYCPITKSAICWNSNFNENKFLIRASGYLLNDNLVLYDQNTGTYWSQMLTKCIKGKYVEQPNATFNSIQTTWKVIKEHFGESLVYTKSDQGKSGRKKVQTILTEDAERVYGILNDRINKSTEVHIFTFEDFENDLNVYHDQLGSLKIIVVGSNKYNFITSFINDNNYIFSPLTESFPLIMKDNYGNSWDIFGIAQEGPAKGEQLKSPVGYFAHWWAWKGFYDDFVFKTKNN